MPGLGVATVMKNEGMKLDSTVQMHANCVADGCKGTNSVKMEDEKVAVGRLGMILLYSTVYSTIYLDTVQYVVLYCTYCTLSCDSCAGRRYCIVQYCTLNMQFQGNRQSTNRLNTAIQQYSNPSNTVILLL
jgi:hypothetical protein